MTKKRRLKKNTYQKGSKKKVTTKPLPWNGDHGTGTAAAIAGTELVPLEGPNRVAMRKKVRVIEDYRSARFYRHGSIAPAFQSRRGKGGVK